MPPLDVVVRHPKNPIVTRDMFPVALEGAYNSGCIKLKNGHYAMAARVNYYNQRSTIWMLDSKDGVNFTARSEPMIGIPQTDWWEYYAQDVIYDPRITYIEETDELLMTVACHGSIGCRIAQFRSRDQTKTWEFIGYQGIPDHRNTTYFPKKINNLYACLDRPNVNGGNGGGAGGIWIKYSPDLNFWGKASRIVGPEDFRNYGAGGIGPGAPPFLTKKGWMCIIHCVMPSCKTVIYTVGAMVLDKDDPSKVVAKSLHPILVPDAPYEMQGLITTVCFPCGAIVEPSGEVKIYYGGADRVTALGITTVDKLLAACGL